MNTRRSKSAGAAAAARRGRVSKHGPGPKWGAGGQAPPVAPVNVRVKVITVKLDPLTSAFDDTELTEFTAANDVVSVQHHLVTTPLAVSLAFVILHRGPPGAAPG